MTHRDVPTTTNESSIESPPADGGGPGETTTDGGSDVESPAEAVETQPLDERLLDDLGRKLTLAAVGILSLLAAYAVFRAYAATGRAIEIWFSADFVPIFAAAFNVVVFLVAVAGVVYLVRRVS